MLACPNSSSPAPPAAGNNLDNACVLELLQLLARPDAPAVTQLDLSMNTSLTWQCTKALSLALGVPLTAPGAAAVSGEDAGPFLKVGDGSPSLATESEPFFKVSYGSPSAATASDKDAGPLLRGPGEV